MVTEIPSEFISSVTESTSARVVPAINRPDTRLASGEFSAKDRRTLASERAMKADRKKLIKLTQLSLSIYKILFTVSLQQFDPNRLGKSLPLLFQSREGYRSIELAKYGVFPEKRNDSLSGSACIVNGCMLHGSTGLKMFEKR
jgi:hypothetical protein